MKPGTRNKGQLLNVLFTMLLFLVFVMCALFTVLIGGKVYENISNRMDENYTGSVALNYVANKVRQGDLNGMVDVTEVEGTTVLELKQKIGDRSYVTQIYYWDGSIRELFTGVDGGLSLADGLTILECEGMKLSKKGSLLEIETTGKGGSKLLLSLRSGGRDHE